MNFTVIALLSTAGVRFLEIGGLKRNPFIAIRKIRTPKTVPCGEPAGRYLGVALFL